MDWLKRCAMSSTSYACLLLQMALAATISLVILVTLTRLKASTGRWMIFSIYFAALPVQRLGNHSGLLNIAAHVNQSIHQSTAFYRREVGRDNHEDIY
jgi:hypothetical protein